MAVHGTRQTLWEVDGLEERSAAPLSKKSFVESLLKKLEEEECYRPTLIFPDFSLFFLTF
jgi:hypothetical protein